MAVGHGVLYAVRVVLNTQYVLKVKTNPSSRRRGDPKPRPAVLARTSSNLLDLDLDLDLDLGD
jgi:hypothetical protein